jgi:hypothetical protein
MYSLFKFNDSRVCFVWHIAWAFLFCKGSSCSRPLSSQG